MKIFKANTHIDFMGKRRLAALALGVLSVIMLGSLFVQGLALGLDFTGGTLIEVSFSKPADLDEVRSALTTGGFSDSVVQHFGSPRDVLVRLAPQVGEDSAEVSDRVLGLLRQGETGGQEVEMRRVEYVGAQVGDELTEQGGMAMLVALIGILIYVALRFEWRFALGAVLATLHDTIVTLGFFSLFQIEFDLNVMAAVLAVIGYSLNDTIVIFDRIRENFRRMRTNSVIDVMDVSINQTLSRTIMTSGTTMLVVVALYIFGGQIVHGFSLALIVGIVIGTISSIYVASPLALWLGVSRAIMVPDAKPRGAADDNP